MSRISLFPRQSRLSRAVSGVLAILALGAVAPAWAAGASDTAATAAGAAAPLTITVQPGQSLNDIAIAATQSHDPGVIARAGRALFDANPQAFMKRDPSRLKLGAALTVPALDATGAAIASGASAASVTTAASAGAASAPHPASAAHAASAVQGAPAASAVHPAQTSDAHAAAATAGASAAVGASAAHGASGPGAEPAAQQAGASGPHVWSGSIQAAPPSASEAVAPSTPGVPAAGSHAAPGAAPVAAASQARPSSLQQLLALKNRVLMELQKHGIGKPAVTGAAADAGRPQAPSAPRPAAGDAGASAAAPGASEAAATGGAASAAQPQTPPVRPVTTTGAAARVDWRPVAAAGAAAALLVAGFMWRRRRNARRGAAEAASGADDVKPSVVEELPIQPETPVSRDAAADVHLAVATAEAVETVEAHEAHDAQVALPSAEPGHADSTPHAHDAGEVAQAPDAVHDEQPTDAPANAPADKPLEAPAHAPADTPAAPAADTHQALMQSAIAALDSLDMPLPPRVSDEASLSTTEPAPKAGLLVDDKGATNGQSAPHQPVGAGEQAPEHLAEQEEEPEWDGGATLHGRSGATSSAPAFAPLGGAQFGALKLDFDLDLPAAPGAAPPALTPDELARIARNKLELAGEYVELGDLAGARTLLQEVIDANDAATRDDARALLAKLADEA
ncbi:FimV/HubP family polar landmark protein [Burkholderia ubonensis]|uniref:FimV/HubP family polar landmark protein n=1 Tax=Burkholderia ubonensis TaxID=101571 RepID=UPI00075617C1|nr:FimV/HubP family polar landmark protein [Burkholderia ubonensis]KVG77301.1 pilus assembly protein FimV [Burkholderia ubonensis]KVH15714.1 pilus assembly protein FimV [Burkholderia ubonensis]KVH53195.1 pilus assembly protein FimV [Burkholderia ubonensis]KVH82250.1 pilus assembly protein FimV [Burkholderia ubonensis]KVM28899.1 pilus assembly protein FimV [Burkholderia ubonensis]